MKISFNYAIEFGSEVPPEIQADAMEEAWAAMEAEGELNRERIDLYDYILEEPLVTVEGFDYAIMAISEHPRTVVVYDYWKCIEVYMVGSGMDEEEAVDTLDALIAQYTDENEPIFIQPFDSFDDADDEEMDLEDAELELDDDIDFYSEEDDEEVEIDEAA
jgi:hypothetical protein